MARYLNLKIKYAYFRFRRKIGLYYTLWLLALLAAVSLITDSIFIAGNAPLKLWSFIIVLMLCIKLGYDAMMNMRHQYDEFKMETGVTDNTLKKL